MLDGVQKLIAKIMLLVMEILYLFVNVDKEFVFIVLLLIMMD